MVDYKVLSPHLDTSKVNSYTAKIPANKIKSMQHLTSTVSSFPYGPSTNHFVDGNVVTVTSGNIFRTSAYDFGKYGFFSQVDDGVSRGSVKFAGMDGWIANGTQNYPNLPNNQPIPNFYDLTGGKIGGIDYIEGARQFRLWLPDRNDTPVNLYTTPRLVEATDINSIGKRTSQVENFRQKLHRGVLFNENNQFHYEAEKVVEFLDSKGVHPKENPFYGLGVERNDGFIAAYHPNQRFLIASTDFNQMCRELMGRYGLTESEATEAFERNIIFHELAHAYGVKGDRRGEKFQGEWAAEFYHKLAKENGGKLSRIYRALAAYREDYAESFSLIGKIKPKLEHGSQEEGSIWHLMSHKFYHEAEALGLEGKAAEKYINSRWKDTLGPLYTDEESHETEPGTANRSNVVSLEGIVKSASGEAHGKSGSSYTRTNGTAKILKFSDRKSKGKDPEKNSKPYARSSARETYERGNQPNYNEDSRNVETESGETHKTADSKNSDRGDSNSESGAECQASEKAA